VIHLNRPCSNTLKYSSLSPSSSKLRVCCEGNGALLPFSCVRDLSVCSLIYYSCVHSHKMCLKAARLLGHVPDTKITNQVCVEIDRRTFPFPAVVHLMTVAPSKCRGRTRTARLPTRDPVFVWRHSVRNVT